MKKSKFLAIYIKDKLNPALGLRPGSQTGVYLIKEAGHIVYVGYSSSNLYRTFTRHFQDWESDQRRVEYKNRNSAKLTARIIYTTPLQAQTLEKALIIKYNPRDNANKFESYALDFKDKELIKQVNQAEAVNFKNEPPPF